MNACSNITKYICRSLIQYCVNSCNNDDNDNNIYDINYCQCNCSSEYNYYRFCDYSSSRTNIIGILSLFLGITGLCLICSYCRSRIYKYKIIKKQTTNTTENPPPYLYSTENNTQQNYPQNYPQNYQHTLLYPLPPPIILTDYQELPTYQEIKNN